MRSWLPLLLAVWPAWAFVSTRHPDSGEPLRRSDTASILFRVNDRTAAGLTNSSGGVTITAGSDPQAALTAAMDAWVRVPTSTVAFQAPVPTPDRIARNNGEHILTFADEPANRTLVGDALAVTLIVFNRSGQILDTDIVFNPARTFSTRNEPGTFDLQATATHELGHALGAGHSGLLAATMYHATRPNAPALGLLTADDVAFVTASYPEPGALESLGSINGIVRFLSGDPVFGALMVAIDTRTGATVGGISDQDGSFLISAVPPGNYYIYAEPANGPVSPSNLPEYYRGATTEFRTSVFGGSDQPVPLGVSAGPPTRVIFTVTGDSRMNIDFAGVATVGGQELFAIQGPIEVRAGQTFDLLVAGRGLENPEIRESDLLLLGAGVSIRRPSLRRADVINGRPALRFTVEVAATAPFGVASVLVRGVSEGVALSAVLKILPGVGAGGPGAPPPTRPTVDVAPGSLRFTAPGGSQTISIGGTTGLEWSAAATTDSGGNWLLLSRTSGVVPGALEVFAVAGELAPAAYAGRITITAPEAESRIVEVTLVVPPPPPPAVLETGVVNAASFQGGAVSPGEVVSILGNSLGPRAGLTASADPQTGRLPTTLGEVVVTVAGIAAPLFFVRHDQINAQIPYELAGQQYTEIEVEFQGRKSQKLALRVAEAKPGLFAAAAGAGQAAALNQDSSVNSPQNPAPVGSVVQLFLTGQGAVSPPVPTGAVAPRAAPFPVPERPVRVTIGGLAAQVDFAGLAPGLVGVLQVNVVVPAELAARDSAPVIVTIGNSPGPANVTIAVR
jgi:uncharacterized protein (TIGR03437 family)